jgi:galactokinase
MDLQAVFTATFHAPATHLIRAPGRVNLIGEHTDYNGGLVLPMAIDRHVEIAARPREDQVVRMVALDFNDEKSEFSLESIEPDPRHTWSNFVRGVARSLRQRFPNIRGAEMLIRGDVPIGSGLSSSAALEVCAALALQAIGKLDIERVELARVCQQAENEFVGVQSGIMDQLASLLAREGHALLIDCSDLNLEHVRLPRGASIVICDTMTRRGLGGSEYNARRNDCMEAARLLEVKTLVQVSTAEFERAVKNLPPIIARRARHVITENDRVLRAVQAAKRDDLVTFGALMNQSHASLRDDFQVSCAELDIMVEIAHMQPGCFGARLTGAGFGGCTVNLVEEGAEIGFAGKARQQYFERVGVMPQVFTCRAASGASVAAI